MLFKGVRTALLCCCCCRRCILTSTLVSDLSRVLKRGERLCFRQTDRQAETLRQKQRQRQKNRQRHRENERERVCVRERRKERKWAMDELYLPARQGHVTSKSLGWIKLSVVPGPKSFLKATWTIVALARSGYFSTPINYFSSLIVPHYAFYFTMCERIGYHKNIKDLKRVVATSRVL